MSKQECWPQWIDEPLQECIKFFNTETHVDFLYKSELDQGGGKSSRRFSFAGSQADVIKRMRKAAGQIANEVCGHIQAVRQKHPDEKLAWVINWPLTLTIIPQANMGKLSHRGVVLPAKEALRRRDIEMRKGAIDWDYTDTYGVPEGELIPEVK